MQEISKNIKKKITSMGVPDKAKWLENYIKHGIKSKGLGIPEIRGIVQEATQENKLFQLDISKQIEILNDLMASEYTEDKLAAIIYMQLNWSPLKAQEKLPLISGWFDNKLITDWNVCDWLCVRLLTPLINTAPKETLKELAEWNKNKNQWKARASLVPFAQCKTIEKHKKTIHEFAIQLIKREERFCKTAVGWVLREYSKRDPNYVNEFLREYEKWLTKNMPLI